MYYICLFHVVRPFQTRLTNRLGRFLFCRFIVETIQLLKDGMVKLSYYVGYMWKKSGKFAIIVKVYCIKSREGAEDGINTGRFAGGGVC